MSQVALLNKESRESYLSGDSYIWCPCCGEPYIMSDEQIKGAIDNYGSEYAYCLECGGSFYIEAEDTEEEY